MIATVYGTWFNYLTSGHTASSCDHNYPSCCLVYVSDCGRSELNTSTTKLVRKGSDSTLAQ
jgi:hypothetical protein